MLIPYLHASFYSLHNMPKEVGHTLSRSIPRTLFLLTSPIQCGVPGDEGVLLPPPMNLTSRRLEAHGLYLIEDGQNMFLWLGKNAVPALVNDAFGLNSYEEVRAGKVSLFRVCLTKL